MCEEISWVRTAAFCIFHLHSTRPSSSLKWGGGSSPLVTGVLMRPFNGLQWVLCSREDQMLGLWALEKSREPMAIISKEARLELTNTNLS